MAKIAYVPYDETMAAIFSALGISISPQSFGGVTGWLETEYQAARASAWDLLFEHDTFDYDGNGTDDWDNVSEILSSGYQVKYWSTDSGSMPS